VLDLSLAHSSLALTREELLALADLLGAESYPGLESVPTEGEELLAELVAAGARSLVARRLVTIEEADDVAVVPAAALSAALAPLVPPTVGAFISSLSPGAVGLAVWWFESDHVVRQTTDGLGVTTFETMSPEDGHEALATLLCVDGREAPRAEPFEATTIDLVATFQDFPLDAEGGGERIEATGPAVERLRSIRLEASQINRIDVLWQRDASSQEIVTVIWIDCGPQGCWLVEPVTMRSDDEVDTYAVLPMRAHEAFERVLDALPDLVTPDRDEAPQ